ncbi:MAG: [Fe-Fe] hydrogenase large subunit C-terminal domain-containing protein [Acidobacteriota bacterium]|jgi:signal transduction histidine kinase/ferredoxin|nr:[Fe-Fe] hydrogenase large subunit C-terminal domain-containing protein [Acidobacteriota bacterium]NLT31857.1 4Fe-4S binding protein [Acidobacteriota bacterium]
MQAACFVQTIKERCRVCYTCVRECPAKAIGISEGQARVIPERCIGCGNCASVCSQGAKQVLDGTHDVEALFGRHAAVAAIVAPSFAAEFEECPPEAVVGMIRALGFRYVHEVGFAADLVARGYRELLEHPPYSHYIASTCPALVGYVERYYPDLVPRLAPIVSPMVAAARVLKRLYGPGVPVVFIGPCIAKKGEAASKELDGEVAAVLTFAELRQMFSGAGIAPDTVTGGDFDPPWSGSGGLFPISRGLLQAADIREDLMQGEILATDGRTNFVEAIQAAESSSLDVRLLEVLCCNGCIMGAGMTVDTSLFWRRSLVGRYVRDRCRDEERRKRWEADMERFRDVDLRRKFSPYDQRISQPSREEVTAILARMGKLRSEDELNCGACGYDTCVEHAIAIHRHLAETEMCLPYTIEKLRDINQQLEESHEQLISTQEALMHSERLASMGQLAAGVAHEVNNPLGIVLMHAHMLLEEAGEHPEWKEDLDMIAEQADRCKKIVVRLLHFARQNKAVLRTVDLGELLRHAVKAYPFPANIEARVELRIEDPVVDLDPDQINQVLTNLFGNACEAMPDGGSVLVTAEGDADAVRFAVADTGIGVPKDNQAKIFEPFFTTKQIGKGTGLGLAVTYGIVKMHRGDITMVSNSDPSAGPTGTQFTVRLPRRSRDE